MKIHHIAITVNSLEESVHFYSNIFNFKEVKHFERSDLNGKAVFMECDNIMLEIWEFSDVLHLQGDELRRIGIRHIAFEVQDLEAFIKSLPESLITEDIQVGSSGGQYIFLKDPSGIDIELYQPKN